MDEYAYKLDLTSPLREPLIRAAIQALQLPVGSRGLDAGCGIGFQARLLAEAVGESGHVTGLDLSADMLAHAQEYTAQAGFADRVSFKEGNVHELPFEDNSFDWAWSMDCVGYLPQDQVPMLHELARVVRPNGRAAILAWSSEQLLPGHPTLGGAVEGDDHGVGPFEAGMKPALHFLRALGWFRTVGFAEPTSRTFAGNAHAPLSDELRDGVEAILQMRWPGVEPELAPQDWAEYQSLSQPESASYILNQPDYYAFFTYSMFSGLVGDKVY